MHSPKIPGPTAEETRLRASQVDELARLDDEENKRVKRLTRARIGGGSLLGRPVRSPASAPAASVADSGGGGGGGYGGWRSGFKPS